LSGMRWHQWRSCCARWRPSSISDWGGSVQEVYHLYTTFRRPIDLRLRKGLPGSCTL